MSDNYSNFVQSPIGKKVAQNLGLPMPTRLERYKDSQAPITGNVIFGASSGATLTDSVAKILANIDASANANNVEIFTASSLSETFAKHALTTQIPVADGRYKVAIFDASGITDTDGLKQVYEFFHPIARAIEKSGRVIVLGIPPDRCETIAASAAQRALEGFVKSVGKEFKKGITSQLIYVDKDGEANLESSLRFFTSPRSAYVSGQVVRVGKGTAVGVNWQKPLAGKTMLVTGASRGIGESIARVLARDGAFVICLDVAQQQADLQKIAGEIGGATLALDITAPDAGEKIAEVAKKRGGLDAIIHNAGVTRDKTLAKMDEKMWDLVLNVNLKAEQAIDDVLLNNQVFNQNARIVCVSSISGIAGNLGQTNYAMSKAGVIGLVQATAPRLKNGITINAVAPGFIETKMTAVIPFAIREAGRRMNSMSQGGLPVDVAETIAWLACPASGGVNGQIVRVCGQSLLGA
ncbi:3-ketoacyl-(acyl-carrier-protein) reductase [Moraxella macacae 0408225]|uniref:3-ketoacyl-(Acyl-carrier-protein) reductase n=1 Tax=Moraxella macacae 0408225 TaxID=1230338 RepID=L2F5L3_9GAMM|nr:3-oxoacyl-ACP reductase [Moraxella macacae]ELA08354.1 3-ketoacyl-(acyl-carrier-protein) reductase [Moraxella macacae 0408225]